MKQSLMIAIFAFFAYGSFAQSNTGKDAKPDCPNHSSKTCCKHSATPKTVSNGEKNDSEVSKANNNTGNKVAEASTFRLADLAKKYDQAPVADSTANWQ